MTKLTLYWYLHSIIIDFIKDRNLLYFCLLGIFFSFSSCVEPPETPIPQALPVIESGAYILNEGNFQWGNARLDYVNLSSGIVTKDIFNSVNSRPVGDVLQSASYIKGNIWLVVNNSGKIEVINSKDCQSIQSISGLQSPRYAVPVSDDRVWVSDLYANGINIVSSDNFERKGFISLPGWTEQMLLHFTGVWVTNVRRSFVYLLHPESNTILDSVEVGLGNQNIVQDLSGNIWILAAGDAGQNIPGRITCVDPETRQIVKQFIFNEPGGHSLVLSLDKNYLFYIYSGAVWKLALQANSLPAAPIVPASKDNILYGLSVHPRSERLFVLDAKDYVSEGKVYEYSYEGVMQREFSAGVIPSTMIFVE
jgi:hypothetical protein